jgi:hypothetical protein
VALDKTGLKAIDAKRQQIGMQTIALSKPDKDSHYLNCQVEHIEIAGTLGLGVFDDAKIDVRRVRLGVGLFPHVATESRLARRGDFRRSGARNVHGKSRRRDTQ